MGKLFNKFKQNSKKVSRLAQTSGKKIDRFANKQLNKDKRWNDGKIRQKKDKLIGENPEDFEEDPFYDDYNDTDNYDPYMDNIQVPQKPASFHHYILEPKYQDLEKSVKGYKDVFHKEKQAWEVKRKKIHCFTDEEAEEILRTAQSHLATDIKLTFYSKETFGIRFLAVYEKMEFLFKRIMEYRYGRYGTPKRQGEMKEQALKIFVELITRIEANYLRALQGMENKLTHESVKSQESLQGDGSEGLNNRGYT